MDKIASLGRANEEPPLLETSTAYRVPLPPQKKKNKKQGKFLLSRIFRFKNSRYTDFPYKVNGICDAIFFALSHAAAFIFTQTVDIYV